ncbi:MAG: alpha/beta hydrolase family protein [Halioglobus sp.]
MIFISGCSDGPDSNNAAIDIPSLVGEFGVGHSTFTAIDATRDNRMVPVDLWYPVDPEDETSTPLTAYPLAAGINLSSDVAIENAKPTARENLPLIIFSHGYGGINTASVVLMETLASHGFIVASGEHIGNSQSGNDDTFDQAAAKRVPDVTLLIDTLMSRSQTPDDAFYQRINGNNVGVIGHSFGGMTALGMAAGWAGAPPDNRVQAIVPISAVIQADLQSDERSGPNAGFTPIQIQSITVPTLLLGGTEDINVFLENNNIGFQNLNNAPAAYQVDISGANHTHFANVCDIGNLLIDLGILQDTWPLIGAEELLEPYATTCTEAAFPIEEVVRLQNLYAVSFFRRHLLGEESYAYYLSDSYAGREDAITFRSK